MRDRSIPASGEHCPCGAGLFRRIARCNDSTDYLNLHYDKCDTCDFLTYAHNDMSVKIERFKESGRVVDSNKDRYQQQLQSDIRRLKWLLLGLSLLSIIVVILKVTQ